MRPKGEEKNYNEWPWLRFYRENLWNEKIAGLTCDEFRHWVELLCCTDSQGFLPSFQKIALDLGIHRAPQCQEMIQARIDVMLKHKFFVAVGDQYRAHDWDGWQYGSDHDGASAVKRKRERDRLLSLGADIPEDLQIKPKRGPQASAADGPKQRSNWFCLHRAILRNLKIVSLTNCEFKIWIELLCCTDFRGVLPSVEKLKINLGYRSVPDAEKIIESEIENLAAKGLFDRQDGEFQAHDWRDWQPASLFKGKQYTAEYRERKKENEMPAAPPAAEPAAAEPGKTKENSFAAAAGAGASAKAPVPLEEKGKVTDISSVQKPVNNSLLPPPSRTIDFGGCTAEDFWKEYVETVPCNVSIECDYEPFELKWRYADVGRKIEARRNIKRYAQSDQTKYMSPAAYLERCPWTRMVSDKAIAKKNAASERKDPPLKVRSLE